MKTKTLAALNIMNNEGVNVFVLNGQASQISPHTAVIIMIDEF